MEKLIEEESSRGFININKCPYCRSKKLEKKGILPSQTYKFSEFVMSTTTQIEVLQCSECGIIFKSLVPGKDLLSSISQPKIDETWEYADYDFSIEHKLLKSLELNWKNASILDIGAYTGDFLGSVNDMFKFKSALDIVEFPSTKKIVNGEYIIGYLDDENIKSNTQYDVITMFDVLEHCYNLKDSLRNCSRLLKPGGYLVLETGDSACKTSSNFGVANWWYLNLIVHHLTLDQTTLHKILREMGFEILTSFNRIHKSRTNKNLLNNIKDLIKYKIFETFGPQIYYKLVSNLGLRNIPPSDPQEKDHMFMIVKKL